MDHKQHQHNNHSVHEQKQKSESHGGHHNHHAHMVSDFKKRFFISVILTLPILALSPMIKNFLDLEFSFKGDLYVLFILSSIIYFYGGWPFLKGFFEEIKKQGKTIIYVLENNKPIGVVALADIVRPESKKAIAMLKEMNIKSIMLTGDNQQVAEQVAKEIGIDEFIAEVLPQDKLIKIKEIQSRNLIVAMTGDGVNDAPALAQADIGIAIGAGTDVAIETADVILVKSNPLDIVGVVSLSRATYSKMIQNLIWATGYNVIAIPIAAGVLYGWGILLSPALGALFMSLSTVVVAINAKFLKVGK